MAASRFNHLSISATNLEESLRFHEEMLGLGPSGRGRLAGRDDARPRQFPELEQLNDRGPQTGEALAATLDLDRRQG
jgi:hypothetical protein